MSRVGELSLKIIRLIFMLKSGKLLLSALTLIVLSIFMAHFSTFSYPDSVSSDWSNIEVTDDTVEIQVSPPDGWENMRSWSMELPPHGIVELNSTGYAQFNYSSAGNLTSVTLSPDHVERIGLKLMEPLKGNVTSLSEDPLIVSYRYVVEGVVKPWMWLSIPAAVLMFTSIILALRSMFSLVEEIASEERVNIQGNHRKKLDLEPF